MASPLSPARAERVALSWPSTTSSKNRTSSAHACRSFSSRRRDVWAAEGTGAMLSFSDVEGSVWLGAFCAAIAVNVANNVRWSHVHAKALLV